MVHGYWHFVVDARKMISYNPQKFLPLFAISYKTVNLLKKKMYNSFYAWYILPKKMFSEIYFLHFATDIDRCHLGSDKFKEGDMNL